MILDFFIQNPELLWIFTVFYDLTLAIILFYFFGKNGLYTAVILGIILANLQGGKVSELTILGNTFVVSMGAIMYSGIYFATDLLNEKYGRAEANRAVIIGAVANVIVMFTLVLSTFYLPSGIASSANDVHQAISTLALYSPIFVIGSITAYLISQTFDVWIFHKIKTLTGGKYLWLRNNASTIFSQLIDTTLVIFILFVGVWSSNQIFSGIIDGWIFKMMIALIDTPIIYGIIYLLKGKIEPHST